MCMFGDDADGFYHSKVWGLEWLFGKMGPGKRVLAYLDVLAIVWVFLADARWVS